MVTVHPEALEPTSRSDRPCVSTAANRRSHTIHYARKSRRHRNYLHVARDQSIQSQKVGPMFVQSRHLWHRRRLRSPIVSTDVIKSYTSNGYNSSATQLKVLTRIYDSTNYSGLLLSGALDAHPKNK